MIKAKITSKEISSACSEVNIKFSELTNDRYDLYCIGEFVRNNSKNILNICNFSSDSVTLRVTESDMIINNLKELLSTFIMPENINIIEISRLGIKS